MDNMLASVAVVGLVSVSVVDAPNPGAKLSHADASPSCRALDCLSRTARVRRSDKIFMLSENESAHILLRKTNRMENPTAIPLEII